MRFWKKLLLAGVGLLIVLAVAVTLWISVASRDIPAPDCHDLDFPLQHIPAEGNAHTWFQAAGEAAVWGDRERDIFQHLGDGTADVAAMEAILATNAPAITLLRRGLDCTACQPPLVTNLASFATVKITPLLSVAKVLRLDSRWRTHHGDLRGALGDCLDVLHYADLEGRNSTTLIICMVAQAVLAMGIQASSDLVASNQLDEASLLTLDGVLRKLDVGRTGMPDAMRGEFQFSSGLIDDLRWGRVRDARPNTDAALRAHWLKYGAPHFLLKPNETRFFYAEGAREAIRNIPLPFKAMKFCDMEADLGLTEAHRWRAFWHGNAAGKMLIAATYPAIESVLKARCQAECDCAGLRLAIACQRYEPKTGHLPEKLDDLVPTFIEAVPADPFDGQPLRYSRARRIVWSVGENLRDDNGSKADSRGGGVAKSRRWMLDYVIDLPAAPVGTER